MSDLFFCQATWNGPYSHQRKPVSSATQSHLMAIRPHAEETGTVVPAWLWCHRSRSSNRLRRLVQCSAIFVVSGQGDE